MPKKERVIPARTIEETGMTEKIFGAPGCNRSELKLVKRKPAEEQARKPVPTKS
jgi:hypothetical protein